MKRTILLILLALVLIGAYAQKNISAPQLKATDKILTDKIDTKTGAAGNIHFDGNRLTGIAPAVTDSGVITKSQWDTYNKDTISIRRYISGAAGSLAKFQVGDTTLRAALVGVDYLNRNEDDISLLRRMGATIITWPIGAINGSGGTLAMSDANAIFSVLKPVQKDTTITGINHVLSIQGIYTGDNYNGIGLYELSGTTLTLIASTASNADMWKGVSGALRTFAFETPVTLYANKIYFSCLLYNSSAQTTAPVITASTTFSYSMSKNLLGGTNSFNFTVAAQTALPATISIASQTALSSIPFIWGY